MRIIVFAKSRFFGHMVFRHTISSSSYGCGGTSGTNSSAHAKISGMLLRVTLTTNAHCTGELSFSMW